MGVSGWMFLLVPAYPGCPGSKAVKRSLLSLSLASVKSRLVLPFWHRLTRVVPDKGPLDGCMCVCLHAAKVMLTHTGMWEALSGYLIRLHIIGLQLFPQTNHYLASPGIHQTLGLLTFQGFFSAQGILITTAAQSTESQSIASLLAISCIIMHNTCMCMMSMYTTANSYGKQKHAVYTNNYVNTVSNTNKVHNIRYTTHTTVYQPFVGE